MEKEGYEFLSKIEEEKIKELNVEHVDYEIFEKIYKIKFYKPIGGYEDESNIT